MTQLVFLLGCLGVLQMIFLPGYIVLRASRLPLSFSRFVLLCVPVSLLVNYLLVFVLMLAHHYQPILLRSIVAVELLVVIIMMCWQKHSWQSLRIEREQWQSMARKVLWPARGWQALACFGSLVLGITAVLTVIWHNYGAIGGVFDAWDPVMSYNQWATEWAANHLPVYTWHYPQLMPINWSIPYVLIGSLSGSIHLQFFSAAIMSVFGVLMVWNVLLLGVERQEPGYWLGAVVTTAILFGIFRGYMAKGWVDVPVAYFGFLAVSMMLVVDQYTQQRGRWLLLIALVLAGGAVTKQAGLYLLLLMPVLVWLSGYRLYQMSTPWGSVIGCWLLALLLALPWYVLIQYLIITGQAQSEVGFVTHNIYAFLGYTGWFRYVAVLYEIGLWLCIGIVIAWHYGIKRGPWRALTLWVVVPFTMIWAFAYSYSMRNFALVVPFYGCLIGLGIWQAAASGWLRLLCLRLRQTLQSWQPVQVLIALLVVSVFYTVSPPLSVRGLVSEQIWQQTELGGSPVLNWSLYRYYREHGFDGKVMTSWDFFGHLPILKRYYQPYRPGDVESNSTQSSWMDEPKQLKPTLLRYPAKYILAVDSGDLVTPKFVSYLHRLVAEGRLKPVLTLPTSLSLQSRLVHAKAVLYRIVVPASKW